MDKKENRIKKNRDEFFDFLKNYNVLQLAVGVVVGGAAKDVVNAIVNDIVMPAVGLLTPNGSWQGIEFVIRESHFKIGDLLASLLNFFIIATIVFFVIKKLFRVDVENK